MGAESKETKLERIWEPLTIGSTKVKNRIMMTAMGVFYGEDNILSDRHISYYKARAEGGAGLIITEQQAGHRLSKGSFYDGCTAWENRAIPQYAKLAEAVHEYDGRLFVQLFAAGVHDKGNMIFDEWHPLWGVSDIPSIYHKEVPHIVDKKDILDLQEGFAKSACNVKAAGLDGAELHAAHSYMLGQFLSPAYNNRTDEYGGSNANRCRFILETAEKVREKAGTKFTLGVRLSFEEFLGEAGTTAELGEEQVEIFSRSGLFDFINISAGSYHTFGAAVPPMGTPSMINMPFGEIAKRVAGNRTRVFLAGRITDLYQAEEILNANSADMVALTRAHFADAHLVKKTQEGRESEIRRCIGANECISRIFDQRPAACIVNPSTGRERNGWDHSKLKKLSESQQKTFIVIGGGIGGLHFAATASERGHKVSIYEKQSEIGGHVLNYAKLPGKERWLDLIEDVGNRCKINGVNIICDKELSPEDISKMAFDELIIATGASWRKDGRTPYMPGIESIAGHNQDNVYNIEEALKLILKNKEVLGKKILMVDESGSYMPLAVAKELLSKKSIEVHMCTPEPRVGIEAYKTLELMQIMPDLEAMGINIYSETNLQNISGGDITLKSIWGTKTIILEDVSSIVFSTFRKSNNEIFYSNILQGMNMHLIGDAMAPRRPAQVIYEAEELGRKV